MSKKEEKNAKKDWGNATWYLFHTLAEKINEQYFLANKIEFFTIISLICNTLPCPTCAEDSTKILNSVNFIIINSKQDLKQFFYEFHNKVNIKLNKPIFNFNEINKYKWANTRNIILNFIHFYFLNFYNEKLLTHQFQKRLIAIE